MENETVRVLWCGVCGEKEKETNIYFVYMGTIIIILFKVLRLISFNNLFENLKQIEMSLIYYI